MVLTRSGRGLTSKIDESSESPALETASPLTRRKKNKQEVSLELEARSLKQLTALETANEAPEKLAIHAVSTETKGDEKECVNDEERNQKKEEVEQVDDVSTEACSSKKHTAGDSNYVNATRKKVQLVRNSKELLMPNRGSIRGKNELSRLIPGYAAPMKLDTSNLLGKSCIQKMTEEAQMTDLSTAKFVVARNNLASERQVGAATGRFKVAHKQIKPREERKLESGWFGFVPAPITEGVKQDLLLIRNRSYLGPRNFYKKPDKTSESVQVGTVIEGASEFYSSRLTKKRQKQTLLQQILADPNDASYATAKFRQIQQEQSEKSRKRKHRARRSRYGKRRKGV